MKTWKLELTIKVADSWVADGFNLSNPDRIEQIKEAIGNMLPYAHDHELTTDVKVKAAPAEKVLEDLQNGHVEPKD